MESYIANTKAFLGIIQASLTDEEFKKSCEAGEKMFTAFSSISNEHELNMREVLNAALSVTVGVLQVLEEQLNEKKGEGKDEL